MRNFVHHSAIEAPVSELFSWHLRDRAFERLTPPWLDVRVKGGPQRLESGLNVELAARRFGMSLDMAFQVTEFESDKKFVDQQVKGPFAHWLHEHIFQDLSGGRSAMHDDIHFELPLAGVSELFLGRFFDADLLRMFRYRHQVLQMDLSGYMKNREHERKKVLVFGHSSPLTEPLLNYLATQGHTVSLIPDWTKSNYRKSGNMMEYALERRDFQVLVNVQSNCPNGHVEVGSRIQAIDALAKVKQSVALYVDVVDAMPTGHLIDTWESLCEPLHAKSIRCVLATHSAILTPAFGVLKKNPSWSDQTKKWIAVDDAVAAIEHCMLFHVISGHVDLTSTDAVGGGKKSNPLIESGYEFRYQTLNAALKHVLGA